MVSTTDLDTMAQSGYRGSAAVVEVQPMTISLYASPPEQNPFLSPTNEYVCQQWPGWDYPMAAPMVSLDNPAGSKSSAHWDAERRGHQPFDAVGITSNYAAAYWASQTENWPSYHQYHPQHFQPPPQQPAVFGQSQQEPTPACSPVAVGPGWQSPAETRNLPKPKPKATATAKQPTNTTRKPADRPLPSTGQHPSKKVRVKARGEPSPASSTSYGESVEWAENEDQDEESDGAALSQGPERKKTYRVKNRAAAKRCREKTKQYEIDLAARDKQVTQERMYLDACVTALKNEVLTLRNQILQHGDCDCDMIQRYIARTANSVSVAARREP